MEPARIETERLLLRPPERADAPEVRELIAQEHVRRYNVFGKLPDVSEMEELLLKEPGSQLSMVLKESGKVIGHIGVERDHLRHRVESVCLDYYLGEEYARRGYMSEALEGLIRHLFLRENMELISARVFVENTASAGLLEKLGFVREGVLRRAVRNYEGREFDDMLYSLLREDWRYIPKIGDTVTIKMDRPIGTVHPKHPDLVYPINYGYVPGLIAPDGEEQDAYVLGVDVTLEEFTGRLIAIIHRFDDVEEKWVLAPEGMSFTREQIEEMTRFQEQYYHSEIRMEDTYPDA